MVLDMKLGMFDGLFDYDYDDLGQCSSDKNWRNYGPFSDRLT